MIFFILPAFNEELNIPTLLNNFNNFFIKNKSFSNIKVVVVDDGSKDNTKKILTKINREKKIFENELSFELINIFHETNRGLGGAIKTGMTYCFNNGNDEDIIITMDCDNSHTIDLCKEMINVLLEGNDVVIASRYKKNSGIKGLSFYRKFLSDLGNPYDIILIDKNGTESIFLGAYGVPETFLIDRELNILKKYIGPINSENESEIEMLAR